MAISAVVRPVGNFSRGFFSHWQSARFLLHHPSLWKYVLIPFLINLVVFSGSVYFGMDFFNDSVVQLIPRGEAWYWATLYYFLWILAGVVTTVVVFFSFTVIGNLIASPFNDLLSERTEDLIAGQRNEETFSLVTFGRDAFATLAVEVKKISIFVIMMLALLLLNLLPVIGSLFYSVLAVLLTLFFLVVEYMGFVFSRKRLNFAEQRRYIFARKTTMLGFGVGILALLAIPFLQFACIPVAVVSATRLWCEDEGFSSDDADARRG
ncbi:sulfate transporter CysZ [Trichloromonas sp.]|uniref:sulfate transporter CysZ n=1 Tax=Trichloromonas sp. TaxID=3069249 RepID=UPI002A419755|nr:sulfate transporter CysZ [Trichloromonas sp.]